MPRSTIPTTPDELREFIQRERERRATFAIRLLDSMERQADTPTIAELANQLKSLTTRNDVVLQIGTKALEEMERIAEGSTR